MPMAARSTGLTPATCKLSTTVETPTVRSTIWQGGGSTSRTTSTFPAAVTAPSISTTRARGANRRGAAPTAALWATNYGPTSFTVTVARIDKLAFTIQPVGGKIPGAILAPVVVQVEVPLGDPVATNGVPVTLSLSSGQGVLNGTLTRNTD